MSDTHHVTWPDGNSVLCYCHIGCDHTDTPRAADLPDGTVVARQRDVWIKSHPDDWHTTFCSHDMDSYVDFVLSKGARVLRYGYEESE